MRVYRGKATKWSQIDINVDKDMQGYSLSNVDTIDCKRIMFLQPDGIRSVLVKASPVSLGVLQLRNVEDTYYTTMEVRTHSVMESIFMNAGYILHLEQPGVYAATETENIIFSLLS